MELWAQAGEVGDGAGHDGDGGESAVAPQAVDTDTAGAPGGVGDVAEDGEQGRVDQGGAGAEEDGGGSVVPMGADLRIYALVLIEHVPDSSIELGSPRLIGVVMRFSSTSV